MFNGKVKFTKFINGKPYFFEREFDNQSEFDLFLKNHENDFELLPNYDTPNIMWIYDPTSIMNQVNGLVDRHLMCKNWCNRENPKNEDIVIDKYEKELRQIEKTKHEEKMKANLQEREKSQTIQIINKLQEYKTKFESENRQDLIDQVNEDISRLQQSIQ